MFCSQYLSQVFLHYQCWHNLCGSTSFKSHAFLCSLCGLTNNTKVMRLVSRVYVVQQIVSNAFLPTHLPRWSTIGSAFLLTHLLRQSIINGSFLLTHVLVRLSLHSIMHWLRVHVLGWSCVLSQLVMCLEEVNCLMSTIWLSTSYAWFK
jgi:ribosomal protein L37E